MLNRHNALVLTLVALLYAVAPTELFKDSLWPTVAIIGLAQLVIYANTVVVNLALKLAKKEGLMSRSYAESTVPKDARSAFLVAVVAAPIGEELLFRGYLGPWLGTTISSALFAAVHLRSFKNVGFWKITSVAPYFVIGVVLCEVTQTVGLVPAVIVHMLNNLLGVTMLMVLRRRQQQGEHEEETTYAGDDPGAPGMGAPDDALGNSCGRSAA